MKSLQLTQNRMLRAVVTLSRVSEGSGVVKITFSYIFWYNLQGIVAILEVTLHICSKFITGYLLCAKHRVNVDIKASQIK